VTLVFNGKRSPFLGIFFNIISLFEAIPQNPPKQKNQVCKELYQEQSSLPRAYFDGAEHNGSCGCGIHILVNENSQLFIH